MTEPSPPARQTGQNLHGPCSARLAWPTIRVAVSQLMSSLRSCGKRLLKQEVSSPFSWKAHTEVEGEGGGRRGRGGRTTVLAHAGQACLQRPPGIAWVRPVAGGVFVVVRIEDEACCAGLV